ncbi:MAG: enoyl-CoA hydratase/isomerase family protein [Alphaproteobacteria bacterium]|nr:enoyl-CoA hydratase/isomerase family protein [Alphaproteobacteria bacterium]
MATITVDLPAINEAFGKDSVEAIIEALAGKDDEFSKQVLKFLSKKSPLSMKISFEQLRLGKSLGFDECMKMEFRMAQACMNGHEFYEGVRSVLVDKDHSPVWKPQTIEEVDENMVADHFKNLGDAELQFV